MTCRPESSSPATRLASSVLSNTEKHLAANRADARKSTGPRTAQGRAVSRWNALQHGVLARAIIPPALEPYESRREFAALLHTLRQEFDPQSAIEEILVERIATSYWRLARLLRSEAGEIAHRQEQRTEDMADAHEFQLLLAAHGRLPLSSVNPVAALTKAMDDVESLRTLLSRVDERWRTASEPELRAAAEQLLPSLREEQQQVQAQAVAIQQAQRSIPPLKDALAFARYEAALERQIYRALAALERIQRMRSGEPVPPQLNITLDTLTQEEPDPS